MREQPAIQKVAQTSSLLCRGFPIRFASDPPTLRIWEWQRNSTAARFDWRLRTGSRQGGASLIASIPLNSAQAGSPAIQQTRSLRYDSRIAVGHPYCVMGLVRGIRITELLRAAVLLPCVRARKRCWPRTRPPSINNSAGSAAKTAVIP
jgi:hypothetical protein